MSNVRIDELEDDLEHIEFPLPPLAGNGHVYVLEFSNGTIKVGKSIDMPRRLQNHVRDAEAFNISAERIWYSDERRFYEWAETKLIAAVAAIAPGRHRREYFTGVTYEQVRGLARTIVRAETDRRMDDAFRLTRAGRLAEAVGVVEDIGMPFSTAAKIIDCYRGGRSSELKAAA